jgi:uncharacterized membrane protein
MSKPTDEDLDIAVAGMLRFGVTLAAIVVLVGGGLSLRHSHFHAGDASLRTLSGIFHGMIHLKGSSIIQLGLVALIATPVARVVLCVVGFARQRNRLYVLVSSTVLVILIYSVSKGAWR